MPKPCAAANLAHLFETVITAANDAVVIATATPAKGPNGPKVVFVNPAFSRITGYAFEEIVGRTPRILQGPGTCRETLDRIGAAVRRRQPVRAELLNYAKDGREYWVELNIVPLRDKSGRVTHFASIERDITEHKRMQQQLQELACLDALTGLPNRRAFLERLHSEVRRVQRYGHQLAFLSLDIDHFKKINDTYGHAAGDAALRHLAMVCTGVLRENDVCGRLGGEEFGILVPQTNLYGAELVARRVRARIEAAGCPLGRHTLAMTASIGVAALMRSGESGAEQMLQDADDAMYRAKNAGRNRVEVAPPRLGAAMTIASPLAITTIM
jgi:diguanylate cyclase (GGDEF)-like protein/PAS domain S-box-containing protein